MITGAAHVYGIIGGPSCRSLSPIFWNAAFVELKINAVYVPFRVKPESLFEAVVGFREAGIKGGNVTTPHKEAIVKHCANLRSAAAEVGAINVFGFTDAGEMWGDNTDASAMISLISELGPPEKACVIGAGGAAKAILWSLCQTGAKVVYWLNRSPHKPCEFFNGYSTEFELCGLSTSVLTGAVTQSDMVINATTLGWNPDDRLKGLSESLNSNKIYIDLNYSPVSRLLDDARSSGAKVLDGLELLIRQGGESFRLLTGLTPPWNLMKSVLNEYLPEFRHEF